MPRTQSPLRRLLATLSAVLLSAAWAVGISVPASAAAVKGYLQITSITDQDSELGGAVPNTPRPLKVDVAGPVQDRLFDVAVRVLDRPPGEPGAQPLAVSKETSIALRASGPGALGDNTSVNIPRNGSAATIFGATYSRVANGVTLTVLARSGVELGPDSVPVAVALTAVDATGTANKSLALKDSTCVPPTAGVPNCGELVLPNGANGHVTLSVGSCDHLGPNDSTPCTTVDSTKALVVTAIGDLGNLYQKSSPATLILACDKDLCRSTANGVPWIDVIYTFSNSGLLTNDDGTRNVAPSCPAKGVVGADQDVCVDRVQSSRKDGDLYLYFLFTHDVRITI